jgi:YD repeat-containing protein
VSTSITVKDFNHEISTDIVTPSDNYRAGETVISAFMVNNDSNYDVTPDKNVTATFTAYYYNGAQKIVVATDTWNNVVIPSRKTNLVYFKWTVPTEIAGKNVLCECVVNTNNAVHEQNKSDNTATIQALVVASTESQTPDTRFENKAPASYQNTSPPASSTEKATWTLWAYENNQFVLKSYGVQISTAAPVIAPSAECKTAVYANGKWTIRSGYGFTMSYSPTITTISGYNNPGSSAYTSIQSVYATFPEFNYATTNGNYRTLQYVDGKWQFIQNTNAADNERIHFIPVWFTDGNYTVSVTATRVWTPVGMIEATRTANAFTIDGSIYDDYFVGN